MRDAEQTFGGAVRQLPDLLAAQPFLQWRGRRFDCTLLLESAVHSFHLAFRGGHLAALQEGPFVLSSWDVALRADAGAWLEHWQPLPRPGFHDLFAMKKAGRLRIEGDLQPLMANLQYVKDVLALPRGTREIAA